MVSVAILMNSGFNSRQNTLTSFLLPPPLSSLSSLKVDPCATAEFPTYVPISNSTVGGGVMAAMAARASAIVPGLNVMRRAVELEQASMASITAVGLHKRPSLGRDSRC